MNEFDYWKYILLIEKRKGLFAVIAFLVMTIAVGISYILPKKYEASSTVFIEKSVISDLVRGIAITPSIEDKIKVLKYALSSRTLLTKVADELDMNVKKQGDAKLEDIIKQLQLNTDIKIKDREGMFIISYRDTNPRLARDYVNTLIRRYIEENVTSKREESYGATTFLGEQLNTLKEKIDKAEEEVNKYKLQNSSLLATDDARLLQENAIAQQKIDDLRIRRSSLEAQRNIIKKGDSSQKRLNDLRKRLEELRVEYTDSYPEVMRTRAEIDALQEQMHKRPKGGDYSGIEPSEIEKLNVEIQSLRSAEESQNRIIAKNQTLLRGIPGAKAGLEDLMRERNSQKGLYEQLLARHGQSEVSKQMEVQDKTTNFRIVDPAILPMKPVSPDRVKIILMGIFFGVAAGIGVVLVLDLLDHSIKDVDTLKSLGIPVLAMIPSIRNPDQILVQAKRDRRVYIASALYFSVILFVLAREIYRNAM